MTGNRSRRRARHAARESGQETLQGILVVAFVLLPILVAIFTFGSMIHLEIAAQAAAAAGARSSAAAGGFGEDQQVAVVDELVSNDVDPATCSINGSGVTVGLGQPIAVTVACPQHVGIPFLLDTTVNLSSTFIARGEVNR